MLIENINWYPGHMKKTRELIEENLKMVDVVVEVVDARIPISSRNPIIEEITGRKDRLILLNKSDLADEEANKAWEKAFTQDGTRVLSISCSGSQAPQNLIRELKNIETRVNKERSLKKPLRIMVVGVPNVGKSTLINRLTGKKSTQTGNRPGVTKGKQWLTLKNGIRLLDTPGILWPKFEDPKTGLFLAFSGSIKDEIMDQETLALELVKLLSNSYEKNLQARYKLEELPADGIELMDAIAKKRGMIRSGGITDYERLSRMLLDEFRSGKIGRITLEKPEIY